MDPSDSLQGQEKPSEQCLYLTPSLKGRQRRKNPKYLIYETDYMGIGENVKKETVKTSSKGGIKSSQKNLVKSKKTKTVKRQDLNKEKESTEKTPPDSVDQTAVDMPRKRKARKIPSKLKKKEKKTVSTDANLSVGKEREKEDAESVKQKNGMPKQKRKYVRKKPEPEESPCDDSSKQTLTPPEEDVKPGGRHRRGAAKAALKYLTLLAEEVLDHPSDEPGSEPHAKRDENISKQRSSKARKGRKRKCLDGDISADEDFVPDTAEEEADEMEDDEEEEAEFSDLESDLSADEEASARFHTKRAYTISNNKHHNGLAFSVIKSVWDSAETTKKFRDEHYSSWVFPDWIPSSNDWDPVPQSDVEEYLPQELYSATFTVSREGLKQKEAPQLKLRRFEAVPPQRDYWDMFVFTGGPLWAMEWCPTPDGAAANQYVAVACHRDMDDLHYVNQTCSGPALVQLWDCGKLDYNSRPETQPALVYGLAQDKGFIWHMKWCPTGGWELPHCTKKAPLLPRLGLLAVATSSGEVTIYSLPHPDHLLSNKRATSEKDSEKPPIYKARGVVTLKLGSVKAPRDGKSGLVLCMDWLPQKPHNIMAIGFYDGVVGLWDLSTKSALLRVREPDGSTTLMPYRCILAHDHAVRALAFCPVSRDLLTTAGEDRFVKMWNLSRVSDPLIVQKRCLVNEIYWPLNAPGLLVSQDCAFAVKGSQGVHYIDHNMRSYFAVPRSASVWSMSYSDWLHSVLSSDVLGEVILSILPAMTYSAPNVKRTIERRFPVSITSMELYDASEEKNKEVGEVEEEGDVVGGQEKGKTEKVDAAPEEGNDNHNEGERERNDGCPRVKFQTYKEAVKKYYLRYQDSDLRKLAASEKRSLWKHMKDTEAMGKINMDDMSLAAIHKVRFNPNLSSHVWLVSGGQPGLLRLHCLRSLISPCINEMIDGSQAHFNRLHPPQGPKGCDQIVTGQL
ncbi:general transcription factor 3C polypeptide 2 [Cololabis saira]|uniref:general transcription factor 3C polypeptide 2 n=1 Tax=Cololabis saira TaxID=129043 RepID=UPI002AD227FF|nr:general transcription factor 3C polypeptide 2 [Cololabis saira]